MVSHGHGHGHGVFIWMIKINNGPASKLVQVIGAHTTVSQKTSPNHNRNRPWTVTVVRCRNMCFQVFCELQVAESHRRNGLEVRKPYAGQWPPQSSRSRSRNFILSKTNPPVLIKELPGPLIEARQETTGATRHCGPKAGCSCPPQNFALISWVSNQLKFTAEI